MSSHLQVDTSTLRTSAAQLANQAATFEGATAATIATRTGLYGRRALTHAVDQLATRWAIGLTHMATDLRDAGAALTQVADTFEAVDTSAAAAARQLAQ